MKIERKVSIIIAAQQHIYRSAALLKIIAESHTYADWLEIVRDSLAVNLHVLIRSQLVCKYKEDVCLENVLKQLKDEQLIDEKNYKALLAELEQVLEKYNKMGLKEYTDRTAAHLTQSIDELQVIGTSEVDTVIMLISNLIKSLPTPFKDVVDTVFLPDTVEEYKQKMFEKVVRDLKNANFIS